MAKGGIPIFLVVLAVTSLFALSTRFCDLALLRYATIFFVFFSLFTIYFFRDPERTTPQGANLYIAPADGRVLQIIQMPEGIRVDVFMSVFNVHVNRIPCAGRVDRITYYPGQFFSAFQDKASDLNERMVIEIVQGEKRVIVKQIAGLVARRIVCHLKEGDEVSPGDRFGMIKFGSRVDLTLPVDTEVTVRVGDHVKAGQTIMGVMRNVT
ncbi:MAG: phosphatidylserine decarboxylase family protein [Candidatus Latescibacterota bacterium]